MQAQCDRMDAIQYYLHNFHDIFGLYLSNLSIANLTIQFTSTFITLESSFYVKFTVCTQRLSSIVSSLLGHIVQTKLALGLHLILIWSDIRPIFLPDVRYPAEYRTKYPLKNTRVYCWLDFGSYFVVFYALGEHIITHGRYSLKIFITEVAI